jgi:dihydrolipoamide dehydrogenase
MSSSVKEVDVAVIGGGPGGYVAAIKAAQLGLSTACIEKRGSLGGTCLNVGCIPSKTLLNISHKFHDIADLKKLGISFENPQVDWAKILTEKEKVVKGLTGGIEYLFKKNGVDYILGHGKVNPGNEVEVIEGTHQGTKIKAKNIILATGSIPSSLPGFEIDNSVFLDSTGALELEKIPEDMIVIGAGVIGMELGSVYGRFGTKVSVIEFADRISPALDKEVSSKWQKILKKDGFKFHFNKKCLKGSINPDTGKGEVLVEDLKTGKQETYTAEKVLMATGRKPYTWGLGLEELNVEMDKMGRVVINEKFQTSLENVYAIGDIVDGPMLAHKAEEEGVAVAEFLSGKNIHLNYNAIPGVIYTYPEIASVGFTEEQLIANGIKYKKGNFPMSANSRARANIEKYDGLVKILACEETDRILGAHIIAPSAGELIQSLVMGIEYSATSEDIARTPHAHPGLSEAVKEAALATHFKAIHI